jgi:hypothetical protein
MDPRRRLDPFLYLIVERGGFRHNPFMTAFERFENWPLCVDQLSKNLLRPKKMKTGGEQYKILDSRSLIMVQLSRNSNMKGGYNNG